MATQNEINQLAAATRQWDPDVTREIYSEMDTSTLCAMLVALATDAQRHQLDSASHLAGHAMVYCIDCAAIAVDVLSSRLPDVGT